MVVKLICFSCRLSFKHNSINLLILPCKSLYRQKQPMAIWCPHYQCPNRFNHLTKSLPAPTTNNKANSISKSHSLKFITTRSKHTKYWMKFCKIKEKLNWSKMNMTSWSRKIWRLVSIIITITIIRIDKLARINR